MIIETVDKTYTESLSGSSFYVDRVDIFTFTLWIALLLISVMAGALGRFFGFETQKSDKSLRTSERLVQEKEERMSTNEIVLKVIPSASKIPELGSRLQKMWYITKKRELVTCTPVTVNLDLETFNIVKVNRTLDSLCHKNVQKIEHICIEKHLDVWYAIVVQKFWVEGSIRDLMYRDEPVKDWSQKYTRKATPFPRTLICSYGRQVLDALLYLYQSKVVKCHGNVHVGNVYIENDTCYLGGYKNSLLAYRSVMYRSLVEENLLNFADQVMFGKFIYDMQSTESTSSLPNSDELAAIDDPAIRDFLTYVFKRKKNKPCNSLSKVRELFFQMNHLYKR